MKYRSIYANLAAVSCAMAYPALAHGQMQAASDAPDAMEETVMDDGMESAMEEAAVLLPPHTPEGSALFVPAPPEGYGQVVFFRSGGFSGMAMGCTVNQGTSEDTTKITSLGSGRYAIVVAEPGTQEYWVKNEKKDGLTLLVEEGETQYVDCRIKMGILSGRPDIKPTDAATFAEKSDKLKLVDDDDMGEGTLRAADLEALQ